MAKSKVRKHSEIVEESAIVVAHPSPINVPKLESIVIDRDANLTVAVKGKLALLLREEIFTKRNLSDQVRRSVIKQILEGWKKECGYYEKAKAVREADANVSKAQLEHERATMELHVKTCLDLDGEMIGKGRFNTNALAKQYKKLYTELGLRIDTATEKIDSFESKINKIEALMWMCTTQGQALDIMSAVLGNHDEILASLDKTAK